MTMTTTPTYITMTEDEWYDKFQPMINPMEQAKNARNTVIFETFGDDAEYIFKLDFHYVWTYMEGDEEPCIVEGRHMVNRLWYYVTLHPWQDNTQYFIEETNNEEYLDCDL